MKVIKSGDKAAPAEAARVLKNGGILVYPTETLYGIGCNAFDEKAIERIYSIKGRSFNKPLIVLLKDFRQLERDFEITDQNLHTYKGISGKLPTLILRPKRSFPGRLVSPEGKMAVRISVNSFVCEMFSHIDFPIVSTSANISESGNIHSIDDIVSVFGDRVELIIDSGTLPASNGSTIVDLTVSPVQVLREGDTKAKDLEGFI